MTQQHFNSDSHKTDLEPLLSPMQLSDELDLSNHVVMAPMTRCMANDDLVPTKDMVDYYSRRAEAGLIITEATIIRADGQGYPNTPGIYSRAQINGWKKVTEEVHANGGKIFLQIWHVGRVSHQIYLKGEAPIAPSNIALDGLLPQGAGLHYSTPRALEADEIPALVDAFSLGARNAMEAGFDGVEIHAANGYLIDQFMHWQSNRRTDNYGGSPENMARFALDVVDAVIKVVGAGRVGIRLSPAAYIHMEHHPDDVQVFRYLLPKLNQYELAYVHTGMFDDSLRYDELDGTVTAFLRKHYNGTLIASGGYSAEAATQAISEKAFDLVAIGRHFIANPDFINKLKNKLAITPYDETMLATLY